MSVCGCVQVPCEWMMEGVCVVVHGWWLVSCRWMGACGSEIDHAVPVSKEEHFANASAPRTSKQPHREEGRRPGRS